MAVSAGDILDFRFTSNGSNALTPVDNLNNTNLQGLGIFTASDASDPLLQVVLGYDDQILDDDNDLDDMMIRADFRPAPAVTNVPLPTTLYLFLSGLLGLGGITLNRRNRRKT